MIVQEERASEMICCSMERMCRGKRCMAWRWYFTPPRPGNPERIKTTRGYCGLAGEVIVLPSGS